jgi:choice-of-anchor B domain-containing protein
MKIFIFILFSLHLSTFLSQNFQLDSIGNLNYDVLHGALLNDVWGYTDEVGNEYAIVGTTKGTSIVRISSITPPVEIAWFPGATSVWRDPSSYGDYAYVTTEAISGGMLIIDLSPLPANPPTLTASYYGTSAEPWSTAHTLYIDNEGYAYIFGANRQNTGVIILDIHTDPMNPIKVGELNGFYVHDGYARNDTLFCAQAFEGLFSIYDISNKANPVYINSSSTPSNVTHNVWLSDNGDIAFVTDETGNSYMTSYDISNPTIITELDRIQHKPGSNGIIHNVHIRGNYAISSYYKHGIVIHDVTKPDNMVEVGNFDTSQSNGSIVGCWGAFPFFSSGLILATDMQNGLFILSPNYQRARYIEGTAVNATTNLPLQGVSVSITNTDQQKISNLLGGYKTGIASGATAQVTFSKFGFYSQTFTVNIEPGLITILNVALVPFQSTSLNVKVVEQSTSLPIYGVFVKFEGVNSYVEQTNVLGLVQFPLFFEGSYDFQIEKWGKKSLCNAVSVTVQNDTLVYEMEKGYDDNFDFDHGWNVVGNFGAGRWERGTLLYQGNDSVPNIDSDLDCGEQMYITGNSPNYSGDVDGLVRLTSPIFDATIFNDPYVNFSSSFFSGVNYESSNLPNDSLQLLITNGVTAVSMLKIATATLTWNFTSLRISDFINPSQNMTFIVQTIDSQSATSSNFVNAMFDNFSITGSMQSLDLDPKSETRFDFIVNPNPTNGKFSISSASEMVGRKYMIFDQYGKILVEDYFQKEFESVDLTALSEGVYYLYCDGFSEKIILLK